MFSSVCAFGRRWIALKVETVLLAALVAVAGVLAFAPLARAEGGGWVRSERETELWSGSDELAVSFGRMPAGSYFLAVGPEKGGRLFVYNPVTKNYAYIDATEVVASEPPREVAGLSLAPVAAAPVTARGGSATPGGGDGGGGGAAGFKPWWVQNHRVAELWSGPDGKAISFGPVDQWGYFRVVLPQQGTRLYVWNPVTSNYAYIDASAVGPSGPPPSSRPAPASVPVKEGGRTPPAVAPGYQPWWVANFVETELWAGPGKEAPSLGRFAQFRRFMVLEPQKGDRLRVWSPEKDLIGYVNASAVGPAGPSVWVQPRAMRVVREIDLPGRAISVPAMAYVRSMPVLDAETELRPAPNNTPLHVRRAVVTPDGVEWYEVGDGEYILASEVRLPRPIETVVQRNGKWIDADLAEPSMVTAYEGSKVVRTMLTIRGVDGSPTSLGSFRIERRVENETMDSESIGIPRDSEKGYLLKNVLYTQYFTNDGAALHYNYWLETFGFAGSRGCLGLDLEDSKWLWEWASLGTPVLVRDSGKGGAQPVSGEDKTAVSAMAVETAPETP